MRPPTCSSGCTTAVWCASCAATRGSGFTRRSRRARRRSTRPTATRASTRWSTSPCVSTRRWPARDRIPDGVAGDTVYLLAPFDPVVWDRRRFEQLWGWAYRFEAYTPVGKRKLGYYALPLLWRDRVIGWGNLSMQNGK